MKEEIVEKSKELFFVEVGVLLNKQDKEFECYNINGFYDDLFGFYDENKLTFLTYKDAKKYSNYYIQNGVENTYSIIYSFICNITDEELKEIKDFAYCEYSLEPPENETVLYFAYKKDNQIIEEIKTE